MVIPRPIRPVGKPILVPGGDSKHESELPRHGQRGGGEFGPRFLGVGMDGLGWIGAKLFLVSLDGWVGMEFIFDWRDPTRGGFLISLEGVEKTLEGAASRSL